MNTLAAGIPESPPEFGHDKAGRTHQHGTKKKEKKTSSSVLKTTRHGNVVPASVDASEACRIKIMSKSLYHAGGRKPSAANPSPYPAGAKAPWGVPSSACFIVLFYLFRPAKVVAPRIGRDRRAVHRTVSHEDHLKWGESGDNMDCIALHRSARGK